MGMLERLVINVCIARPHQDPDEESKKRLRDRIRCALSNRAVAAILQVPFR